MPLRSCFALRCSHQILDSGDNLSEKGIKPLMLMSESQFLEFQRDAASVLYSLSINSDNKLKVSIHPAAQRSLAVRTLIYLYFDTRAVAWITL